MFEFAFVFYLFMLFVLFFFFKQKTAYEMRISDWSSDVCSSDLILWQSFKHRCQEQAWRNRHHTDFMLREIACHRKCHSDHAALGRAIGHLPYLPVESRHRRRVDDDASFSIQLVSRSLACCKFCNHVERADQDRKSTRLNSSH